MSRGHPLILSRLGTLAGEPEALAQALDELEANGLGSLPDLFTGKLSAEELAYLEDAAVRSVDLLLERASADAQRLLWVVALASEPVTEELVAHAWSEPASVAPLLAELTASGLLASDGDAYAFHELVRERVETWAAAHPEERGGRTEAVSMQAKALSALADLWYERGDRDQAVALARQALAVRDRLPDLADRSISHGNLSDYLDRSGETEEASRHLLAAIVYDLVTNHRQFLATDLHNLGIRIRRAAPAPCELPRLADLLSRPEFDALKRVLEASGVDAEGLQGTIDGIVERVRQSVS